MFQGHRSLARAVAISAAGACCLAAVACGSSSTAASGERGAIGADPLASLNAHQVITKVIANAKAASSLTLRGNATGSDGTETLNLAVKPGHGCTGTMAVAGKGSFKLTQIGDTVYLNPDKQFWKANGGANAAKMVAAVNGRYLKVATSDKTLGSLAGVCDVAQMFSTNGKQDTITKGKVSLLNGTQVLALNNTSDGSVAYVTDTSQPRLVQIVTGKGAKSAKGAKTSSGTVAVSYGAPVTLTPPSAAQVIDGAKLGL